MDDLDKIINEAKDAREVKGAVSVKMSTQGFSPTQICHVLNVSLQYVSKWKGLYEAEGGTALRLGIVAVRAIWRKSNGKRFCSGLGRGKPSVWKPYATISKSSMGSCI